MQDHELTTWLGPAADELDAVQRETVRRAARRITDLIDADLQDERDAALSAVVQTLLGELDLSAHDKRRADAARRAAAIGAVLAGTSEVEAARSVGVDRMTVRKWLGK